MQQEKPYTILSTKTLSPPQKTQLLNANIALVEYDAIYINPIDFHTEAIVENAIITSQNAAQAIIRRQISVINSYCVGQKTASLLKNYGTHVSEIAEDAVALGKQIIKKHAHQSFIFFCGNRKRAALPELLKSHHVFLKEVEVYTTQLRPRRLENIFEGILFFSPSAVKSYILKNTIGNSMAFCIGNTTASEVKKYTKNICIARHSTIENVLLQVIKHKNAQ